MTKSITRRFALQAAVSAAIIAAIGSVLLLSFMDKENEILFFTPAVAIATLIITFIAWRKAFRDNKAGLWRAAWIGAIIVIASMFLMWIMAIFGIIITGNVPTSDYGTSLLEKLLTAPVMAIMGLILFGPVLIPAGMIFAIFIRWLQLRSNQSKLSSANKPRRKFSKRFLRNLRRVIVTIISLLVIGAAGFALLIYLLLNPDSVTLSSHSPSGEKTFEMHEGCMGHACWHNGELILRQGFFRSTSAYCNLGIIADWEVFGPGSKIIWNADETIITWHAKGYGSGTLNLQKDCRS